MTYIPMARKLIAKLEKKSAWKDYTQSTERKSCVPGRLLMFFFDEHRYVPGKLVHVPWHG